VVGLEPSEAMIKFARNNFPEISFTEGISSSMPFPEESFDLIVAFEVFRYLDKAENIKTYDECKRILKKDGKFFFTQVNTFSSDFYYFFYYAKKLVYKVINKVYHFCFFITPSTQTRLLKEAGYSSVETVGRMAASIRLAYKFGKKAGDLYVKLMEKLYGKQRFTKWPMKSLAGHLIVIAKK
jgi:ubiquinone/menaquinone biosynthesis C-methylase UbiE